MEQEPRKADESRLKRRGSDQFEPVSSHRSRPAEMIGMTVGDQQRVRPQLGGLDVSKDSERLILIEAGVANEGTVALELHDADVHPSGYVADAIQ